MALALALAPARSCRLNSMNLSADVFFFRRLCRVPPDRYRVIRKAIADQRFFLCVAHGVLISSFHFSLIFPLHWRIDDATPLGGRRVSISVSITWENKNWNRLRNRIDNGIPLRRSRSEIEKLQSLTAGRDVVHTNSASILFIKACFK